MKLTKEYLNKWLEEMKNVWLKKNLGGLVPIFGKIENYYESPFLEPGKDINDVINFWKEIESQEIINLEMEAICVEENIGIAHWFFEDTSGKYDGVYEIKFDQDLNCIEFRQWCCKK